jgi:hypothetical protein
VINDGVSSDYTGDRCESIAEGDAAMSREAIEELLDRWMDDPAFRNAIRQDPEATVRASGLELDADEWAAVRRIDWSLSDEELTSRANKSGSGCGDGC